jgi:hypothetical protein
LVIMKHNGLAMIPLRGNSVEFRSRNRAKLNIQFFGLALSEQWIIAVVVLSLF